MGWCVYMLRCSDGSLYTGMTDDFDKRLKAHREGRGAKYTRSRSPLTPVYREECEDRQAALRREAAIKKLSRTQKLALCGEGDKPKLLRSLMQAYVCGSREALEFYKKAFDAREGAVYPNPDGSYMHAELDLYGQAFAISERRGGKAVTGNTMQMCLHFRRGDEAPVRRAYEVLCEGAKVTFKPGRSSFSSYMFVLTDRYGVNWCLFCD